MTSTYENDDIFRGIGVEVSLPSKDVPGQAGEDARRADFLKVRETLMRMGMQEGDDTLVQSCYILHKRGRYVIAHLSELEQLDGANVTPCLDDIAVRNRVAILLENWELVDIYEDDDALEPAAPVSVLKILPHRDKARWNLVSPYDIGRSNRVSRRA